MRKLSYRHITARKFSKRAKLSSDDVIEEMRRIVKEDSRMIDAFKKYKIPLSDIDTVHIDFVPLGVSAKTKNMEIYINEQLLDGEDPVESSVHYLVHELLHYCQQKNGKSLKKEHDDNDDYLEKPSEIEAFKAQIDFKKREESEEDAEEYVDQLLDHHSMNGKERQKKKQELIDE